MGGRVTIVVCMSKGEYYGMFPHGGSVYYWTVPPQGLLWDVLERGGEWLLWDAEPGSERVLWWAEKYYGMPQLRGGY